MNNQISKMYFYESFAGQFDSVVNMYDTHKRLEVIFDEFLTEDIKGKELLDAGCGTGWASQIAVKRGANVTSMDLGQGLLEQVAKKCESKRVVGSVLHIPFKDNTFDYIVCTEVIEHVTNPSKALRELYRVLKPDGVLILTTPNSLWYFSLVLATKLNLRPYQGLENWHHWGELKQRLQVIGFEIMEMKGVHLFPFVIPATYPILNFFHQFNKPLGRFMVNIAVKCKKSDLANSY